GYGIDGFWLGFGALTGAAMGSATRAATSSEFGIEVSIWTTEGYSSLVLPLLVGGTMSFVTLVSHSIMVLLERVPEPEDEASQLAVEESRVDEPELGNPRLGKPVLDKPEASFDHD
nr:hypothetical protein [Tanacetum cinerariifolium]